MPFRLLALVVFLATALAAGPALPPEPAARSAQALERPEVARESMFAQPQPPLRYSEVRRWMYEEVFHDRPETLYCGCPFDENRVPDQEACGYVPRRDNERARRVEVEHVLPASWIGQGRACWSEPVCTRADGSGFRGRDCCNAIDESFRIAHHDLHNLWPAIGEINADRGNLRFAEIDAAPGGYGACDIVIDNEARQVQPRAEARGAIARMMLYMADTHGIRLRDDDRRLYLRWHRENPPDGWERLRNARIRALQGNGNPYVEDPLGVEAQLGGVAPGPLLR
jgi:deoxyribonuclease I